jgi:hypothetical protein
MIDPAADLLDPSTYLSWRLRCLAASAAGQPRPPVPTLYRPEVDDADDHAEESRSSGLVQVTALEQIRDRGVAGAQGQA